MLRGAEVRDQQEGSEAPAPVAEAPPPVIAHVAPLPGPIAPAAGSESWGKLFRVMLLLALPIMAEHFLHIGVGLTDTYLANNLVSTEGLAGEALAAARSTNAA